jgi:predicted nuclease with TOPRIM domain
MNKINIDELLKVLPKLIRENDRVKGAIISALSGVVATHEDIVQLTKTMDDRFERMDNRFNSIQQRMDDRFERMDNRFNSMQQRMDDRFERMDNRFNSMQQKWTIDSIPYNREWTIDSTLCNKEWTTDLKGWTIDLKGWTKISEK